MAEVILAELHFATIYISNYGAYGYGFNFSDERPAFSLELGDKCIVYWDGSEYEVTVGDSSSIMPDTLYVGNASGFGLPGNGEPFAIAWDATGETGVTILSTVDTVGTTHLVSIYAAEEEEESPYDSSDISLKRYSGEDRVYEDVEVVHLMHASGEGTVPYSRGRAIENVPITLDLQNDDQLVTAPDGTLVKSAIIAKPEDLSPENVRYGKVIANVRGEFIGDTEELVVGESEGAVPLNWGDNDDGQIITPSAEGKSFSKVTLEKPDTLIGDNIRSGIVIAGVEGTMAVKTEEIDIELNLATGNQVVYPSSDEVHISKVTIIKPENLKKEHIAAGVEIAGITGEFQGATGDLPQLYAPTAISTLSTDSSGRKYFTVTNPYTKNGMFPRTLQLLASAADGSDIIAGEVTLSTTTYTSTVTVYATNFTRALALFQPRARFAGDMFRPSETFMNASVLASVMAVLYELVNVTLATEYDFAFEGDVLKLTLTPGSGYYLPKSVMVVGEDIDGDSFSPTHTYTPASKLLTLTCSSGGKTVNNISVAVEAVSIPWLATPTITTFSYPTLKVTCDPNTDQAILYINGLEVDRFDYVVASAGYAVNGLSGITYGFGYDSSIGYYRSLNKGVHSSFALCRINFSIVGGSATVVLQYINYAESNYDFGIISQIDTTLLRSSSEDTTGVLRSFKGSSSSTAYTLSFTVPEGNHFVEVKYRKDGSQNSGNDEFRFKINSIVSSASGGIPTINLSEYADVYGYGDNEIELIAIADGFTESDPATRTYTLPLTLTKSGTTLATTGTIPVSVTAYELYIDNILADTVAYDGSGSWSIDLHDYQTDDNVKHSVYVVAIGNGLPPYQSNVIETYLNWYTVTYYDSDGETVLYTQTVDPNTVLTYKPTKSGYVFTGWSPELAPVTADVSYTAGWETKLYFATSSWADIAAASEAGKAALHFNVGDTRVITLSYSNGSTEQVSMRIVGTNHDDLASGSGKAGLSIMCAQFIINSAIDVTENTTYGQGYVWANSATRSVLNGTIFNALPSDLRAVIKSVRKTSNGGYSVDYGGYSKNVLYTTNDKVWLPSATEIGAGISTAYCAAGQGAQYPYFTGDSSRTFKRTDGTNDAAATRSMHVQYSSSSVAWLGINGSVTNRRLSSGSNNCTGGIFGFCV